MLFVMCCASPHPGTTEAAIALRWVRGPPGAGVWKAERGPLRLRAFVLLDENARVHFYAMLGRAND